MNNALINATPRLRLPQKSRHNAWQPGRPAIQDMPTRPAHPPLQPKKPEPYLLKPLQVGVGWNTGIARRNQPNEDSLVFLQGTCTYQGNLVPFGIFVVADGMGGHECGQEASRIAIQCMMHTVLQNVMMGKDLSDDYLIDMLVGGVEWANLAIYHRGQADGKEMGTTLTAALIVGMKAYIANVGDSRTYLFREEQGLRQITQDHSLVATLVASGQIRPEEIYTHPERNKVYRSLGHSTDLKVDNFTVRLRAYDSLLLCSDGLWEMVRDPVLERMLSSSDDVMLVSDSMVQAALRGGGTDNVSAIVVQVP